MSVLGLLRNMHHVAYLVDSMPSLGLHQARAMSKTFLWPFWADNYLPKLPEYDVTSAFACRDLLPHLRPNDYSEYSIQEVSACSEALQTSCTSLG